MYPSAKRISEALRVDVQTAKLVRGLMNESISPEIVPAVRKWLQRCVHRPRPEELAMEAINAIICGCGVEAIEGEEYIDNYYINVRAVYCNLGDSEQATVIRDNESGRYLLLSVADFISREMVVTF